MGWVRDRRVVTALAAAYVTGLVVLVASPWGWELNRLTVRLYDFFRDDWAVAPRWMLPEHYGVLLNVLLFLPVGVLLVTVAGRRWRSATVASFVTSVVIELVQWRWLEREGDWTDVVANTLGGMVGAIVVSRLTPDLPPRAPRAERARRR